MADYSDQIAQLLNLTGERFNLRGQYLQFVIDSNKDNLESLVQILTSGKTNSYAGKRISDNYILSIDNSGKALKAIKGKTLNRSGVLLSNLISNKRLTNIKEYNKGEASGILVNIRFDLQNEQLDDFQNDIQKALISDIDGIKRGNIKADLEEIENFEEFSQQVLDIDEEQAEETPSRAKSYFEKKRDETKPTTSKEVFAEPEEEIIIGQPKTKKTKPPKGSVKPTRRSTRSTRFQGKFGKGINSFNSRLLLTRLHSLNGSTIEIYNLGNKILKRLEQHRENAARNL